MGRLTKFSSLPRREKALFCEAIVLLSLSNMCLKTIAFKHVERFLRTHWTNGTRAAIDYEQESPFVKRSVSRAANALPWKSLCLTRSIAEFIMLRRRGIPAVIFAGVRFSGDSSLDAHAWVRIGSDVKDKHSDNSDFVTMIKIGSFADDRLRKY
jgi:hypothetical protein